MHLVGHSTAIRKPSVTAVGKQLVASVVATSAIEPSNVATTSIVAATFGHATAAAVVEVSFATSMDDWQLKDVGHTEVKRIKVRHKLMACTTVELEEYTFDVLRTPE